MTGTFIDTIIICTLTGPYSGSNRRMEGATSTVLLLPTQLSHRLIRPSDYLLCVCLALFAFTTILGWNYYSERCMTYLAGTRLFFPTVSYLFSDCVRCIPQAGSDLDTGRYRKRSHGHSNLIALIGLSGVVVAETRRFNAHVKEEEENKTEKEIA